MPIFVKAMKAMAKAWAIVKKAFAIFWADFWCYIVKFIAFTDLIKAVLGLAAAITYAVKRHQVHEIVLNNFHAEPWKKAAARAAILEIWLHVLAMVFATFLLFVFAIKLLIATEEDAEHADKARQKARMWMIYTCLYIIAAVIWISLKDEQWYYPQLLLGIHCGIQLLLMPFVGKFMNDLEKVSASFTQEMRMVNVVEIASIG